LFFMIAKHYTMDFTMSLNSLLLPSLYFTTYQNFY